MEPNTINTFKELFKVKENNFCFECGTQFAYKRFDRIGEHTNEWASVNNGIFLCGKCATLHKKFGPNVSAVRSIPNDKWSDVHLAIISQGGNNKLKDYFEKYHLPRDCPMDYKYRTKAAFHYRKMLRAASEGTVLPDTINPDTALDIDEDENPQQSNPRFMRVINQIVPDFEVGHEAASYPKVEKGLEKMYSYMEETFDQTVLKTKEVANMIGVSVSNTDIKQSLKGVGDKIASGARKGVEEAYMFWRKLSGQEVEEKVHIPEENLEVVYSTEGFSKKPSRRMNKENMENVSPNS